jgi:hypothetical protein
MHRDSVLVSRIGALALAVAALWGSVALAQTQPAAAPAPKPGARTYTQTKTAWGHPDLQGFWTNTTTTPLERPDDLVGKDVLTDQERAKRNAEVAERVSFDRRSAGNVGAYNEFWMERGALNNRTSLVVDPPSGKIPSFTTEGKARADALLAARKAHPADSWTDRAAYDRCISRGIPGAMMPGFYNHNYQILQTPTHVAIVVEMIHDARIIPIDGRAQTPSEIKQWLGRSRGHWEGNTLVIETRNVTDKAFEPGGAAMYAVGGDVTLTERFTRTGPDTIDYQFTVDAPKIYTRPWTVLTPMLKIEGPIYEYACHEGNYAIKNILSAARAEESGGK